MGVYTLVYMSFVCDYVYCEPNTHISMQFYLAQFKYDECGFSQQDLKTN